MKACSTSTADDGGRSSSSATASAGSQGSSAALSSLPRAWLPSQFYPLSLNHTQLTSEERANALNTLSKEKGRKRNVYEYSLGEEIANSITHGIGALLAIAAIPILIVKAVGHGSGIYLFTALVYVLTMLLEYLMSTLYHAISADKAKRVFKVLDHSCIYLFIAGTYTPFCLISLEQVGGIWLCVFVWVVALAGVACEAFWVFRPRWISALLYLCLGWSVVCFLPQLISALPTAGLVLLTVGGACYSLGCVFYVLKKVRYMHTLFHIWVLAGSICHFLAVALFVM